MQMFERNEVELRKVAEELIDAKTPFLAVPKKAIANDTLVVYYYLIGHNKDLNQGLNQIESVTVAGQELPIRFKNVLQTDVHFVSRVPLYAADSPVFALSEIPLEAGLENLRKAVNGKEELNGVKQETVELEKALKELRDEGAFTISLRDLNSEGGPLHFVVHIPTVIGAETVERYNSVTLDGETYSVDWTYSVDGPGFEFRIPVFSKDYVPRHGQVSIETGLENVREYVEGKDE